jgi:hypothetical protein
MCILFFLALSFGSIVAPLLIPAIATSTEYVPKMVNLENNLAMHCQKANLPCT